MSAADGFAFTPESKARAEREMAKYPKMRQMSAVMALLDIAQRQNSGWLSRAAIEYVADVLSMPVIRVYEVATFYTMYNLRPMGRHHVQVCTNLPCWLRGSDDIVEACREFLDVDFGETTRDGLFTLSEVECLGACANAPMVQIDDDYYEDLDPDRLRDVLSALRTGEMPSPGPQSGRRCCEPVDGLTSLTSMPWHEGMGREGAGDD